MHEIREVLGEEETDNNNISKMENHNVRRFDEILKVSDVIMVAGSDLAIEISSGKFFLA